MTGTDGFSGFERCLFPFDLLAARVDDGFFLPLLARFLLFVSFTESKRSESDADAPPIPRGSGRGPCSKSGLA